MFRVFTKRPQSHDWERVSEHLSQAAALAEFDQLSHSHKPGCWCVRNTRGELIAKATVTTPTAAVYWTLSQVQPA